jgi:hypothetical protein
MLPKISLIALFYIGSSSFCPPMAQIFTEVLCEWRQWGQALIG